MKRTLSLILCGIILASTVLTSCSENKDSQSGEETKPQNDVTNVSEGGEEVVAEQKTEEVDRFADVDFGGRTLTISTSIDTSDATNGDRFIRGEGEYTGEAVNDAVYERNLKVQDDLGIVLEFIEAEYSVTEVASKLKIEIESGDSQWQVSANDIRAFAALSSSGHLANVYDNTILDMEKSYWYKDAMEDLMFLDGGMYLIVGDYFTDALASVHTLYANEEMLDNLYNDPDYVNNMVFEGKWTIDEMTRIVTEAYQDTDGDGEESDGDTFGYECVGMWGSAIPALIGLDIDFVSKTEDSIEFTFNNEHSVEALNKLHNLYYATGTNTGGGGSDSVRVDFANKKMLFMGYNRLGNLEDLRDIDFPMGVLPYPKYDEAQQNYVVSMHDSTEIGAIPSTIVGEDLEFVLTCLEVLGRETAKTVMPTYYDDGLKVKYADGLDDAKMIDLIHDSITSPFAVAYDQSFGNFLLRSVFLDPLANDSINFSSNYTKFVKAANKLMQRLSASFQEVISGGN